MLGPELSPYIVSTAFAFEWMPNVRKLLSRPVNLTVTELAEADPWEVVRIVGVHPEYGPPLSVNWGDWEESVPYGWTQPSYAPYPAVAKLT